MKDVFISYSHRNAKFVGRLVDDLRAHGIDPWVDTLELTIGDRPRQRIEAAISDSRYFCLVVSPASMASYYVKQLEIEAAFQHMVRKRRRRFILPILWRFPKRDLPLMLGSFHYLDFGNRRLYTNNISRLVQRLQLDEEHFTGSRLYKNVDTSLMGHMYGVGPLQQLPRHGAAVKLFFEDGRVTGMHTYTDGEVDGTKEVRYDDRGRVYEITLERRGKVQDTWRYVYGPDGVRTEKLVLLPGHPPHLRWCYDADGNKLSEEYLRPDGTPDDSRGFARKRFIRDKSGTIIEEALEDAGGVVLGRRPYSA